MEHVPTVPGVNNDLPVLGPNVETIDLATVKPFDDSYLRMMVLHYRKSLKAAELAVSNASHTELKEVAEKMADRTRSDLARFEVLRDRWYTEPKAP